MNSGLEAAVADCLDDRAQLAVIDPAAETECWLAKATPHPVAVDKPSNHAASVAGAFSLERNRIPASGKLLQNQNNRFLGIAAWTDGQE
ncbi:MAG: hypothetical protein WCA91_18860 [Candidatus Acidiferrales bacterium]